MWNSFPISVLTRASVRRWSWLQPYAADPASSATRSQASYALSGLHAFSPGPLDSSAASPPACQNRRHWFTDFMLTRRHLATYTAPISCSNICAAYSGTF
jgi:hypothetical protein